MTYYPDLEECDYFGKLDGRVLSVGWLDLHHDYTKGAITEDSFKALFDLVANAWQPRIFPGFHRCELCIFTGGPLQVTLGAGRAAIGNANLFLPGRGVVYVAPSMILHYVDAHQYKPPQEFVDSVHTCPPMGSAEYLAAVRATGVDTPRSKR